MILIDVSEAAQLLKRSAGTIRNWARARKIPAYQPNGKGTAFYFDRSELLEWVKSAPAGATQETPCPIDAKAVLRSISASLAYDALLERAAGKKQRHLKPS